MAPWKIPDSITCVLTSCARWDVLCVTLDTFMAHHRPARFIVVEDSADQTFARRVADRYPSIEIMLNPERMGQHRSVDRAYASVDTPYIFHLEDDWHFLGPARLEEAISLLDDDEAISSICFRRFDTLKLRHRIFGKRFVMPGGEYARMAGAHRDWHGFSFNPSLLRKEFWERNGPYFDYANERTLSRAMKDQGKEVVFQLPGVAFHIGSGKSVYDPQRANENRRISGSWRKRLLGRS